MSRRDPRWIERVDSAYALLLHLYPRRFRKDWATEMRQVLRDRCREVSRGERRLPGLLIDLVPDLVAGAGRERYAQWGDMDMLKRNVMFALLLAVGATFAFHEQLVAGTLGAFEWWQDRHQRADARAWNRYRTDVVEALAADESDPRSATLSALLQPGSTQQEQTRWARALRASDPLALWLAAIDCPVGACAEADALGRLMAMQPDNAAVVLLEVETALEAGDESRIRNAFQSLRGTTYYRDHYAIALPALLEAAGRVVPPARLLARHELAADPAAIAGAELAGGYAMALAMPGYDELLEHCRPARLPVGPVGHEECVWAARTMADADSFIARSLGLRIWNRFAVAQPAQAEVHQRIRDYHWQFAYYACCAFDRQDHDDGARWRAAWLAGGGEMTVLHRLMRADGVSLVAPPDFEPDPRFFDPAR